MILYFSMLLLFHYHAVQQRTKKMNMKNNLLHLLLWDTTLSEEKTSVALHCALNFHLP